MMNTGRWLGIALVSLGLLAGCTDTDQPTASYATFAQAREDGMVRRGWLPDILPETTRQIQSWHAMDSQSAHGHFVISEPVDTGLFVKRLLRKPKAAPTKAVTTFVQQQQQLSGLHIGYWQQGIDNWVFAVNPATGQVNYRAWVSRSAT